MAEEQKPVEVVAQVADTTPAIALEETPAVEAAATTTENAPVEESKPADATEETEAAKEDIKEEVEPIEEGFLSHKAQGASFPKNLIASKAFFFFGTDAFESEFLSSYKKAEKSVETAHHNIAWASHTGKGLLFIGDKKTPTGVINLADATEPETDGSNKFHFSAKGNKHSFKANSAAERDNWVSQLKEKIAEAKELVATVTESETYKQTVESFKPIIKEPEAPKEDAVKADEAANTEEALPREDEAAKDELKTEEPKRRSASRKRASFFGFGKKEDKKDEPKADESVAPEIPALSDPAAEAEAVPAEETPVVEITADGDDKPTEEAQPESPKEKPAVSKRNSFFGGVFSKKEKKVAEVKAEAADAIKDVEAAAESAPVIPPVETSTDLAVDVTSPDAAPAETAESPVANGESKKDVKEKRKSSLPFIFNKRDKSPAPEGEEKTSKSAFSKLRATIKGKGASKAEDKTEEVDAIKEGETEAKNEAAIAEDAPKTEEPEAENKPENVASAAPAITTAA